MDSIEKSVELRTGVGYSRNERLSHEQLFWHSLRGRLKTELSDDIEQALHNFRLKIMDDSNKCDTNNIVDHITKTISSSDSFKKAQHGFLIDLVKCAKETVGDELRLNSRERQCVNVTQQKSHMSVSSSLSGSLNQSSVLFLSNEQLQETASLLLCPSPLSRLDALQVLCNMSSLEQLLIQNIWLDIEKGLHESLTDQVNFIRERSLKVYVKMLSSSVPQVVKESFHSLLKFLIAQLFTKEKRQQKKNSELMNNHYSSVILHVLTVVNRFQQCISEHWLRYPQTVIEDIIQSALGFFALSSIKLENANSFYLNIIALIDPPANWLKYWLYGSLSRSVTLHSLSEHMSLTEHMVNYCSNFDCDKLMKESSDELYINADGFHIDFHGQLSIACNAACFIAILIQYSDGRKLLNEVTVTCTATRDWMQTWEVSMQCALKLCDCSSDSYVILSSVFPDVCGKLWQCNNLTRNSQKQKYFLNMLVHPLICFQTNVDNFGLNTLGFISCCLCKIIDTENGLQCLLNYQHKGKDVTYFLAQCFKKIFSFKQTMGIKQSDLTDCLFHLLELSKQLLKSSQGILKTLNNDLIHTLGQEWNTCRNTDIGQTNYFGSEINSKSYKESICKYEKCIRELFLTILGRPLGTVFLLKEKLLEDCVNVLFCSSNPPHICIKQCSSCLCVHGKISVILSEHTALQVINPEHTTFLSKIIWQMSDNFEFTTYRSLLGESLSYFLDKLILRLACIYSSFSAVKLLLISDIHCEPSICPVDELYERMLFLKSNDICRLNNEDLNVLFLRILRLLVCCLRTFCCLQAKYNIQEVLLYDQNCCLTEEGTVIIDEHSVLRNNILVQTYTVGGPSERTLPPKVFLVSRREYTWPFVVSCSLPEIYYSSQYRQRQSSEIDESLSLPFAEFNLKVLQRSFSEQLMQFGSLRNHQIQLLLEKGGKYSLDSTLLECFCLDEETNYILNDELSDYTIKGIKLCVKYGQHLNLLHCDESHDAKLSNLLKSCNVLLGSSPDTNFDIFVASIFLMMHGDENRALLFLENFVKSNASIFLWTERVEKFILQNKSNFKIHFIDSLIAEYFDLIVKENLPCLFSALEIISFHPSLILRHWVGQCFWNYLDWPEICHFVILAVLYGGDCVLYFCVAVLKHMEDKLLQHIHAHDFIEYIKESCIVDFTTAVYLPFIFSLFDKYHLVINDELKRDLLELE